MVKSIHDVSELVRPNRHLHRSAEYRGRKAHETRHERRKVRNCLRHGWWQDGD